MTGRPLIDLEIPLDRVTWRDGQLLTARDLRDEKRSDDQFRYLHVRYLHDTWGIVTGFDVAPINSRTVSIAPGFALDIEGREILLPTTAILTIPDAPAAFLVLGVRYRPNQIYRQQPNLTDLCLSKSPLSGNEQPEFFWTAANDPAIGREVLLAGAWAAAGRLEGPHSTEMRRYARTEMQPRFFAGVTAAAQTGWAVKADANSKDIMWLEAQVDTSEAGFVCPPYYFAQVVSANPAVFPFGPPTLFIQASFASSFRACIAHDKGLPFATDTTAAQAETDQWVVSWLAVEAPYVDVLIFKGALA